MNNINMPIAYEWRLGWGSGVGGRPVVNPLLKAIIEMDIPEMDRLVSQGASLKESDKRTLQRVLFHVADCSPVMKWLVAHGVSRIGHDLDVNGNNGINDTRCISPAGYSWGLIARAYYLKAYDVMDLLAAHGFDYFTCYDQGWDETWQADIHILQTADMRGLKVLLENGYYLDQKYSPIHQRRYKQYVLGEPQVRRKSIGLSGNTFGETPTPPEYEAEPLLFGRRDAKARNARRREDYEDYLRAYNDFVRLYGEENHRNVCKQRREFSKLHVQAMRDVLTMMGK